MSASSYDPAIVHPASFPLSPGGYTPGATSLGMLKKGRIRYVTILILLIISIIIDFWMSSPRIACRYPLDSRASDRHRLVAALLGGLIATTLGLLIFGVPRIPPQPI